jgi:hypothetical protein
MTVNLGRAFTVDVAPARAGAVGQPIDAPSCQ